MIKVNGKIVDVNHFPDGTLLLKSEAPRDPAGNPLYTTIQWYFESNEELVALIFLTKHLRRLGVQRIKLSMPYISNARQDRIKNKEDVFTLKYFADVINSLEFDKVEVLDPHSSVSEALINNVEVRSPEMYIYSALHDIKNDELLMFYPDEGSCKRYSGLVSRPYAFGIKRRNWETGQIEGLDVAGDIDRIKGATVLIVDDICSRGGTFYHSAKKLKELGAKEIFLYVTHCENTIFEGDLLTGGLIDKIYTTNSIFTKEHEKIKVFNL